ncbi:MAG TPA: mechanosensitive ion channel domain-containing protein [Burkholderiales bacterium]|nr:mechanosensitive ion channel domain-containing protein [Burkholderiales bacterium]
MSNLIADLISDLQQTRLLWQLGALLLCLGGAWQLRRLYQYRIDRRSEAGETLPPGMSGIQKLIFPLSALALALIARWGLHHWQPVKLLNVAVPLLFSFALIRVAFYVLRHTFASDGWLRAWERYIAWVIWIGVALYVTGLWPEIINVLDAYDFHIGKQRVSLLLILQGALSVLITLLIALWLGRFVESRLMRASTLDINLRVMLSKLSQALLVLCAILIALPAVGIDLTLLSVFGGMLGVGIGFGLQKIASNYISGFIILMDRSVRIGDLVTIDQHTGQLTRMTARYVVVRSLGGLEAIIPNEAIIASTVINHSHTDPRVRVAMPIQISYQSDLETALKIMEDAARRHPRVLKHPEPGAVLLRFGDSGIDLELGIWIEDPQEGTYGLRSDIYREIWRDFKKHDIEIPYPQREVRILNAGNAPDRTS